MSFPNCLDKAESEIPTTAGCPNNGIFPCDIVAVQMYLQSTLGALWKIQLCVY